MFLSVGCDPQGNDETVIAEMHSVDQQRDEIEVIKGRTPPGRELRGRARDEAAADRALAGPRLFILGPTGTKLRAYWRVATPTSVCSTTRRSTLPAVVRTRGR